MSQLVLYTTDKYFGYATQYIYKTNEDKIESIVYQEEKCHINHEWRFRRNTNNKIKIKTIRPYECDIITKYQDKSISIKLETCKDHNGDFKTFMERHDCISEEKVLQKLTLSGDTKELLLNYMDEAKESIKSEIDTYKIISSESIRIFYYKKEYWTLLSKCPKRPLSTIYLKEGQKEEIIKKTNDFFSEETRDIYLSFGIPYKSINLVYGVPGSGKTSMIKALASELDCDLYILPITKELDDYQLVDALSYISENEDKKRIIVMEDIDTIFDTDRKEGDDKNMITLQGFLNCLDGFTCIEGTMLFITANKPQVLDFALIRSCRIDNKIELDYADKYQIENMFRTFLPHQIDKFKDFYKGISHHKITTAMLQEFLFYNRTCENVLDIMDDFQDIIKKNDPITYEANKSSNFYM